MCSYVSAMRPHACCVFTASYFCILPTVIVHCKEITQNQVTHVHCTELSLNSLPWHLILYTTEYIFYCMRAILFLSSSKILTPHPPLRPASLSSPRNKGGGYTPHSAGGEGDGGSIFWKTREIGLPSYSKICTLCCRPSEHWLSRKRNTFI